MRFVTCRLRRHSYQLEGAEFRTAVESYDDPKAIKQLQGDLKNAIRGDKHDPDEHGHQYHFEVRADNGDHLFNVRLPS